MGAQKKRSLLDKLKDLPPERLAEIEDFVDFIHQRESDRALVRTLAKASEETFSAIWENDADAAYDKL